MAELKQGELLQTVSSKKAKIEKLLGEGGQGAVYMVDYDGAKKAFKWYSGRNIANPKKFYENLQNNIKKGKPSSAFLWPEDITEKQGEAFGCVMDLRPTEYKEFFRFLLGRENFAGVKAMTNAALQIAKGFSALHQKGCYYQDFNDGNLFINPENGNVLFCDNDSVSESGFNPGITGKSRYIAPEVMLGKTGSGIGTDNFSLALILFQLFVNTHPLEGKAVLSVPIMNDAYEKKFYGDNPVFIFDPTDTSNEPVPAIHKNAINRWSFIPQYLKELFIKAFNKQALRDPAYRVTDKEWVQLFTRMKEELKECSSCGAQ